MKTRWRSAWFGLACLLLLSGCGVKEPAGRSGAGFGIEDVLAQTQTQDTDSIHTAAEENAQEQTALEQMVSSHHREEGTTVMIYMVGSNLESESGAASADICEMLDSGIDLEKNRVIVYTGGSRYWKLDISSGVNSVLELCPDRDGDGSLETCVAGSTDKPVNMGQAQTLSDFLTYSYQTYPSGHYALICWDHGSGPVFGFGADEMFDYDSLTVEEFETALKDSPFNHDNKLDWIGFDACLMSCVEYADMLSEYADYLIASQETEPSCGWNYAFLSALNQTWDGGEIGRAAIDSYVSAVEKRKNSLFAPDITLSCLELTKMPQVSLAMDNLFEKMSGDLEGGAFSRLARIRDRSKRFGLSGVSGKGESLDLVDLGSVAQGVCSIHEPEAKALLNAIDDMVTYQNGNVEGVCGVSVYYPYDNQRYFRALGRELYGKISASDGYRTYLEGFTHLWLGGAPDTRLSPAQITPDGEGLTLALSPQELEQFSSASYTIFLKTEGENGSLLYAPVIRECRVEPDENGVLRVPLDQKILVGESGGDQMILNALQTDADETGACYRAGVMLFQNAINKIALGGPLLTAGITLDVDAQTDQVSVKSISMDHDELPFNGKSDISIANWSYLGYTCHSYLPVYHGDELLPYTQWEEQPMLQVWYMYLEDDLRFSMIPASRLPGNGFQLACQIVVTDTCGNRYASELEELTTAESNLCDESTANGTLTYELYSDHAVLIDYDGTDTRLILPETVRGVPVTKIKYLPFVYNSTLKQIQLPATLEDICGNPFVGCPDVNVVIDSANPCFKIVDGDIYTKDGTGLVAVMDRGQQTVDIPEGVARIEDYALSGIDTLTHVKLPSTLEEIGDCAFYDCPLAEIELPEGLEKIGFSAFCWDQSDWSWGDDAVCSVSQVRIPASVVWIGEDAFAGLPVTEFSVERGNPCYAANGPFLTDAAGTELIAVGGGLSGTVSVPEGIIKLRASAFDECSRIGEHEETLIKQLELPESLQWIDGELPDPFVRGLERIYIGQNLSRWNGVERQEPIPEAVLSPENMFFKVKDGKVVNVTEEND